MQSATQVLSKFGNIIIAGEFNRDTGSKNCNIFKKIDDFCDTFDLANPIHAKTCFKLTTSHSSLNVILTNRPRSFQKTATIPTGFSDYHKMITTT